MRTKKEKTTPKVKVEDSTAIIVVNTPIAVVHSEATLLKSWERYSTAWSKYIQAAQTAAVRMREFGLEILAVKPALKKQGLWTKFITEHNIPVKSAWRAELTALYIPQDKCETYPAEICLLAARKFEAMKEEDYDALTDEEKDAIYEDAVKGKRLAAQKKVAALLKAEIVEVPKPIVEETEDEHLADPDAPRDAWLVEAEAKIEEMFSNNKVEIPEVATAEAKVLIEKCGGNKMVAMAAIRAA